MTGAVNLSRDQIEDLARLDYRLFEADEVAKFPGQRRELQAFKAGLWKGFLRGYIKGFELAKRQARATGKRSPT